MTKFEEDRQQADARYVAARRAMLDLPASANEAEKAAIYGEFAKARLESARFAQRAGSMALKAAEAQKEVA